MMSAKLKNKKPKWGSSLNELQKLQEKMMKRIKNMKN